MPVDSEQGLVKVAGLLAEVVDLLLEPVDELPVHLCLGRELLVALLQGLELHTQHCQTLHVRWQLIWNALPASMHASCCSRQALG